MCILFTANYSNSPSSFSPPSIPSCSLAPRFRNPTNIARTHKHTHSDWLKGLKLDGICMFVTAKLPSGPSASHTRLGWYAAGDWLRPVVQAEAPRATLHVRTRTQGWLDSDWNATPGRLEAAGVVWDRARGKGYSSGDRGIDINPNFCNFWAKSLP